MVKFWRWRDVNQQTQPVTFDAWLANQDDTVKGLLTQHTQGLKSALDSERTQRQVLSRQLKDLQGKAEKGSDTEEAADRCVSKLEQTEWRAAFVEEAVTPGVGCLNVKAAYALAVAESLFDRKGNPDWAAIETSARTLPQTGRRRRRWQYGRSREQSRRHERNHPAGSR